MAEHVGIPPAGRVVAGKGGRAATLDAVVTDPPAPLRRAGPIGPVIQGLLAKDPARRLGPDQTRSALQAIQDSERRRPWSIAASR